MELTESQQECREWYHADDTKKTIIGAAGSGKTFLIAQLIADIQQSDPTASIAVSAPTNKAVRVLSEKLDKFELNFLVSKPQSSQISVGTIHKFLMSIPTEDDEEDESALEFNSEAIENRPYRLYDYIFVDEASMISESLYRLIEESVRGKLLYIGDPYQLFPVGENRVSYAFRESKNIFYLEGVVRYQGNLLKLASRIRERIEDELIEYAYRFGRSKENIEVCKEKCSPEQSNWFANFIQKALEEVNSDEYPQPDNLRMLVYKKRSLELFSSLIREKVYGEDTKDKYLTGECLFSHSPFYAYYNLRQHLELYELSWLKNRTEQQNNRTKCLLEDRDNNRKRLPNSEDFFVENCELDSFTFEKPFGDFYHPTFSKKFDNWEPFTVPFCRVTLTHRDKRHTVALLTDKQRIIYAHYLQYLVNYWKKYEIPDKFLAKYKSLLNNTFNVKLEYQRYNNPQDRLLTFKDGTKVFKVANKVYSSWVITVHKSQGTTLRDTYFNYTDCFTRVPGQSNYDSNSNLYRLLYTAVTRTSRDLWVFTKY